VFKDGTMSGVFSFEPAIGTRAMEPMAVSLRLEATGEAFERAGLEDITAKGYLGKTRLVTMAPALVCSGARSCRG
jgi:hypothetical protein